MTTATKTKLKIFPLADRVAIRPLEDTEEMKGGLYIPDTAKEKPIQGEVIAGGPGRMEKGQRVPMELQVRDRVVYRKYTGSPGWLDAAAMRLLQHRDGAGAGVLPRRPEVRRRGRQPDVAEARHRQGGRAGGGGGEAALRAERGPEGDRPGRGDLSEQRAGDWQDRRGRGREGGQ